MASTIGKVRAVFTASTSGLTAGVNQASASMRRLQNDVRGMRSGMSSLVAISGVQLFGNITSSVSSAVSSLVRMGQASADVIDKTSKMASRLGMTYGEFSGLALAGDLAGVSMESIGAAATKADVAFVRAANGSKQAISAFSAIGLSVEQLNGLSASERFDAIAEAISKLPTEAQRSAAAVSLFGRAGAELLPLFSQGAGAIAAARAEAERFGLALTNAQGQDVEAMNDAFTRAQAAIQGVIQQVVAYLAPAVKSVTDAFSNLIGNIGGANIGQAIGDGILAGARYLAQIGDWFIANMKPIWEYASSIGQQWNAVWSFGQRVADFFAGVANTLDAVMKGVASLIASVVGRVLNAVGELAQKIPGYGAVGQQIEAAGESLMRSSRQMWSEAGSSATQAGRNFSNAFGGRRAEEAGQAVAGPLTTALDAAIAQAEASAASMDVAQKAEIDIKQPIPVDVQPVKTAIQGVDARSSEGIKEMFRVMRGENGVQEQQLAALNRIADNTEDNGDPLELEAVDLAPAAGG